VSLASDKAPVTYLSSFDVAYCRYILVTLDSKKRLDYPSSSLGHFEMFQSINRINNTLFQDCKRLTKVYCTIEQYLQRNHPKIALTDFNLHRYGNALNQN